MHTQEAYVTCPWSLGSWETEVRLKLCRQQGCTAAAELSECRGVLGTCFNSWHKAEVCCTVSLSLFSPVPFPGPPFSCLEALDVDSDLHRVLATWTTCTEEDAPTVNNSRLSYSDRDQSPHPKGYRSPVTGRIKGRCPVPSLVPGIQPRDWPR